MNAAGSADDDRGARRPRIPRQRKGAHDDVPSNEPPHDITTGELWRGLEAVRDTLDTVNRTLVDLPAQLEARLEARLLERHAGMSARVDRIDEQVNGSSTQHGLVSGMTVLTERVALLQRLVFGAVGITLAAVVAALLALVVVRQ